MQLDIFYPFRIGRDVRRELFLAPLPHTRMNLAPLRQSMSRASLQLATLPDWFQALHDIGEGISKWTGNMTSWNSSVRSAVPSLLDVKLVDLHAAFASGILSAEQLVGIYMKRVDEVDGHFKSILEVNPDAVSIAKSLDEEMSKSGRRSVLHGVPITLKDNIVTLDSMEATAGSIALLGAKPPHESTVARKLREAGAILLAKSAMTEWANYRWDNAGTGWSPRGGQCTGPFYPNMKASGSSTGAAVSTVLGLAFAGIGTETDGSITNPAGKAAIIGIKPSTGLVSRAGIIPASQKQDTPGPMARTVKDAAAILSVIAGYCERDERTWDQPFTRVPDYVAACERESLVGVRIGVPRNAFDEMSSTEFKVFEQALDSLRKAGAIIVDPIEFRGAEDYRALSDAQTQMVVQADMKRSLEAYFGSLHPNPQNIRTLSDLIEFTRRTPEEDYPTHNTATFEAANGLDTRSKEYREAEEAEIRMTTQGGIHATLAEANLDALVTPLAADVPVSLAAILGSPVISMPLGVFPPGTPVKRDKKSDLVTQAPGIPFPICFYGARYEEEKLIGIASVFEKVHDFVRPPIYKLPTSDLADVVSTKL